MASEAGNTLHASVDVAFACSVELGDFLKSDPAYSGKQVNINPSAVHEILESLGATAIGPNTPSLLFTLVSPHDQELKSHSANGTTRYDKDSDTIVIRVPLYGHTKQITSMIIGLYSETSQQTADISQPQTNNKSFSIKINGQPIFELPAAPVLTEESLGEMTSTVQSSLTQIVAVHELQHAADYTDDKKVDEEHRYIRRMQIKALLGFSAITALKGAIGYKLGSAIPSGSSLPELFGEVFGLSVYARKIYNMTIRKAIDICSEESPLERRAYQTHQQANSYPSVITLDDR